MNEITDHAQTIPPNTVPFSDVRALLDAIEAVLDLPKDGAPDPLFHRLAFTSGALGAVTDPQAMTAATTALRKMTNAVEAAEPVEEDGK